MAHLPADDENKVLRVKADEFVLDNHGDRRNAHTNISTRGNLGENDIFLQKSNLYLDDSASIGFQGIKMITNLGAQLIFTVKPTTEQIASVNYASQTLEYELDQIATNVASKLSSSGYAANKIVITSGAGNITTGGDIADYITETSTSTLTNKSIGDIKVVDSYLYIRNTDTGAVPSSNILAPTRALRIPMYCNNASNNKDAFMTLIDNNSYELYTATNISQIGSDEVLGYGSGQIYRFTHGGNWINDSLRIGGSVTSTPTNTLEVYGASASIELQSTTTNNNATFTFNTAGTGSAIINFENSITFNDSDNGQSLFLQTDANDTLMKLGLDTDRYRTLYLGGTSSKFITGGDDAGTGGNNGFLALGNEDDGTAGATVLLIGKGRVAIGNVPSYPETYNLEITGTTYSSSHLKVDGDIKSNNVIKGKSGAFEVDWLSSDGSTTTISDSLTVSGSISGTTGTFSGALSSAGLTVSDTINLQSNNIANVRYQTLGLETGTTNFSEKMRLISSTDHTDDSWITAYEGTDRKWIFNLMDRSHSDNFRIWFDDSTLGANYGMTFNNANQTVNIGQNYHQSTYMFAVNGTGLFQDDLTTTDILPITDDLYNLGGSSSSQRWDNIYATSGTVNTSDQRLKTDISNCELGLDFINNLRPVSYKWKKEGAKRKHYGLISQEVKEALEKEGVKFDGNYTDGFAGFCYDELDEEVYDIIKCKGPKSKHPDEGQPDIQNYTTKKVVREKEYPDIFGLRYTQFIAPLVKSIQELAQKHETLNKKHEDTILNYELKQQELNKKNEELNKKHEELKARFENDIQQEKDRNIELETRLSKMETMCVSIMTKLS